MTDTDYVLDALRLRVTPCAHLMLLQLASSKGPLDLVHRCADDTRGVLAWAARGHARAGGLVEWAASSGFTLFVRPSDVPALQEVQLVIEVEFHTDHTAYDSAEARLITLFRPHTESEREMLDYVMGRRVHREAAGLLSRVAGSGRSA